MKQFGSQIRETLKEAGAVLIERLNSTDVLLRTPDTQNGHLELWIKQDDFAGYVIEIDSVGYEYINSNSLTV